MIELERNFDRADRRIEQPRRNDIQTTPELPLHRQAEPRSRSFLRLAKALGIALGLTIGLALAGRC